MTLDPNAVIAQIEACLADCDALRAESKYSDLSDLPRDRMRAATTRGVAAIHRLSPAKSVYIDETARLGGWEGPQLVAISGILQALRADFGAGYLRSIEELIHADVFADFLEMAVELQTKGFKDPAAVIAGSVLEEHLRKLAAASGVAVEAGGKPRKADSINADLVKASVYTKLAQSQVTAWLAVRNAAAHGKYDEYDHREAAALIDGVRDFMVRHPA